MAINSSRALLLKLAIATALLAAAGIWLANGYDAQAQVGRALEFLRTAGPLTFFLAMTLLPAVGAPMAFFSLMAGSVFGPQLGMPVVTLLTLGAVTANMALGYFLANRALRPPLEHLVKKLGYHIPEVASGDVADVILLLRVTPGVPFTVQNFLLGIAAVPFLRYMGISCLIALPMHATFLLFGKALMQGRGRTALIGMLLLVALMAALHLVCRRYRAKLAPGG